METLDFCAEVVCFLAVVQAGPECLHCEEGCSKARPPGCPHPCVLPCHPGECPPCVQMLRIKCHCKITSLYVECRWVDSRKIHIVLKLFEWCLGLFLNPTFCRVFSFVFLSFFKPFVFCSDLRGRSADHLTFHLLHSAFNQGNSFFYLRILCKTFCFFFFFMRKATWVL